LVGLYVTAPIKIALRASLYFAFFIPVIAKNYSCLRVLAH
jgi:hypothetical protein